MYKIIISVLCAGLVFHANSQTVKTYAGAQYTGSGSYNSAQRSNPKDTVLFSAPMGIEVDTAGRIYVSNEHNIYWIKDNTSYLAVGYNGDPNEPGAADSKDFAGIVSRFARPAGLAINPNTNELMVADLQNCQIRKVERFINTSTQQIVSTFAGVKLFNGSHQDGSNSTAKFNGPAGIAVAANGDVYVADRNNHCIRKISGGVVSTIAGAAGMTGHVNGNGSVARFLAPYNVFIDGNDLLVADYGNKAIRKINLSTGDVTDLITSGLFGPKDLCKVGNALFIAEELCVKRYENNVLSLYAGSVSQSGYVNGEGSSARFADISGIVYHQKQGLLYVVDMGNNVVRSISPNLRPICSFTTSTTSATTGQTIILTSTSSNKPTAYKWTISPASYTLLNNSTDKDSVVYLSFSQTGTYSIKLWVSNQSGADSLLKNNLIAISTVTAAPVADFKASNTTPLLNEVISLIDLSSNSPTNYTWRISPGNFIWMNGTDSNSKIPNIKFTNGNNFTVTLIASNAQGGNSTTKVDYIKVNGSSITSLLGMDLFTAYPNPATLFFNLHAKRSGLLQIFDLQGRPLYSEHVDEGNTLISTEEFNEGTYLIYFITDLGIYSEKIIINH